MGVSNIIPYKSIIFILNQSIQSVLTNVWFEENPLIDLLIDGCYFSQSQRINWMKITMKSFKSVFMLN